MSLYCLIHGSTQNAEGWGLLTPELGRRGHRALAVGLPLDEPEASATRYADLIVRALDESGHESKDAIVVAHSAGGMFLPLVAARRPVRRIVFLAALVPRPGVSIIEQFRADPGMLNPEWVGKNPLEDAVAEEFLFHDCESEVKSWALTTRVLLNARRALAEACPLAEWPDVAGSYVVCAGDRTISPAWSRRAARDYLGVEAIELPGGHCPHVSRPGALADVLTGAAVLGATARPEAGTSR